MFTDIQNLHSLVYNNKTMRNYDNKNRILNWLETFAIIAALWFIMSGIFEIKFIAYGSGAAAIISYICVRTLKIGGLKSENTYFLLHFNWIRMIRYFFWLVYQIILSAIYVSKVALFHRDLIDPAVVWFKADYDNPAARSMLANSITLTPGTITIDMYNDGIYSVHGLTKEVRDGLLDGSMQAKVAWLYNETIDFKILNPNEIPNKEHIIG